MNAPEPGRPRAPHSTSLRLAFAAVLLGVAALIAITALLVSAPARDCRVPVPQETRASLQQKFETCWFVQPASNGEDASFMRLRTLLALDSFALMPAYVTLLVLALFWSTRGPRKTPLGAVAVYVLPLAAGLFAVIENGLAARAAEDAAAGLLDETAVAALAQASRVKFALLLAATAEIVLLLTWRRRARDAPAPLPLAQRRRRTALIAFVIAGVCLGLGLAGVEPALRLATLPLAAGLVLLAAAERLEWRAAR